MVGEWVDSNVLALFTIIHFIRIIGCKYGGAVGGACQQVEESTAVIVFLAVVLISPKTLDCPKRLVDIVNKQRYKMI